jgi:tetrahydromethanopterin S-methyltransferase subunit H
MFRLAKEQTVCNIGGSNVGGQPGENPPLLIGNMFQKGDRLIESRKERKFDKLRATERIREMERLSQETGVPGMVAMVANTANEMKAYVDFLVSVTDMPFAIDIWVQKTRLQAAQYVAELRLQDRVLYNSITPWDEDIPAQVTALKEMGIKHVVVQAFDAEDKMPSGRIKSLKEMLELVGKGGFESILVDTAVMNLPATAFSLLANRRIKEQFGLPVGCAPSNGTYMWKKSLELWGQPGFAAVDASVHAISALWSDFLLFGPMTGTGRVFPAVAATAALLSTLTYDEVGSLPSVENHPLNLLFPEMAEQLEHEVKEK